MERIERMPVPVLPAFVGALTLSNVYSGIGYSWIRHLTMWAATVIIILYMGKLLRFTDTCRREYGNVVPCSLYAGFDMALLEAIILIMYRYWGRGSGLLPLVFMPYTSACLPSEM